MPDKAPSGIRTTIGVFGRRNAGKSSLINALVGQDVSIVSETPGTTTDVVSKPYELVPVGPVLFLDTAGLDDEGELGLKRVARTRAAIDRTDVALIVSVGAVTAYEEELARELQARKIVVLGVLNKIDSENGTRAAARDAWTKLGVGVFEVSAKTADGLGELKKAIVGAVAGAVERSATESRGLLADLVGPGDLVILVVPIDLAAPKGRLILPQVQVLREILDCDAQALVVKERELASTLSILNKKPRLVITDSQAILKVSADVPHDVPVTGFSVLFARWKGDLNAFINGTRALDKLKPGDHVLIAESCSHHSVSDDIGRVKIPRWLQQYVGGELRFTHIHGHDFPEDLSPYKQIILCGGCMTNRREVLSRIARAEAAKIAISNYGLCIAHSLGVLERMLSPFAIASFGKSQ